MQDRATQKAEWTHARQQSNNTYRSIDTRSITTTATTTVILVFFAQFPIWIEHGKFFPSSDAAILQFWRAKHRNVLHIWTVEHKWTSYKQPFREDEW